MEIIEYLDKGVEYTQQGLEWIRGTVESILGWGALDGRVSLAIAMLVLAIFIAYKFICKFTVHPFSTQNIIYLGALAFLLFMLLMYF